MKNISFYQNIIRFPQRARNVPTKPRSRSVPDVMVLNSQLLAELLIKYQRLPRGFFWNHFLPSAAFLAFL